MSSGSIVSEVVILRQRHYRALEIVGECLRQDNDHQRDTSREVQFRPSMRIVYHLFVSLAIGI